MIKWSFSGYKDYENCPKQYYEVRVARNFTKPDTPQTLYGKEVHKACEDYVRDGTALAKNYLRFKPTLDALKDIPGTKYLEHQMGLRLDKSPCEFDSPDYWVRGIADYLNVDDDIAHVADYKTGSARYPEPKQLKLMALMTFAHFPQVNRVNGALLFLLHNVVIEECYERSEIPKLWEAFAGTLNRIEVSRETGKWNPNPTGLCGWCPVETCSFFRRR
jgi:hypothetical protein